MTPELARMLNSVGLLAVCALLAAGFFFQIAWHELPCPLCLLQRVGFVAVGFGLALNVIYGPRSSHYAIMSISALFGASVSIRQILLHIVPGTGTYGSPVFGLHYYTWAAIVFFAILAGSSVLLLFDRQFEQKSLIGSSGADQTADGHLYGSSSFARACIYVFVAIIAANFVSTFLECGPLVCADNPVSYQMLK
jgi:disulfide bond formation protein DsbB